MREIFSILQFHHAISKSAAIALINRFIDQALSYGSYAETVILQAIAADPTCAIAHAYAAAYYLSQENQVGWQQAQPYLQASQQHLEKITTREKLYVQAIAKRLK